MTRVSEPFRYWGWRLIIRNIFVSLLSLLISLAIAEALLRGFHSLSGGEPRDIRSEFFRYDPKLGWLPQANVSGSFTGARTIQVKHDEAGFRGSGAVNGGPYMSQIMVIGDSFVWGYDVEEKERFTNLLRGQIENTNVLNFGVTGYGSDQELLLLQDLLPRYEPDVVLLIFTPHNDRLENSSNLAHRLYFKPFFEISSEENLELSGVPVPKSLPQRLRTTPLAFLAHSLLLRELASGYYELTRVELVDPTELIILRMFELCNKRNISLIIGLVSPDQKLEKVLLEQKIRSVDLSSAARFQSHGKHWTPEGHRQVSELLKRPLKEAVRPAA